MRALWLPLFALFAVACSGSGASAGSDPNDPSASSALTEEKALTLDDVYLGHADPRGWEPGDAQYYFPVAAQIFYGYRALEGYRIERGDDCATFDVKESANADAGGDRNQAKKYEVSCKAKNATTSRVVARSKQNFTAEEDEPAVVLGSSLVFESGVKLTKVGPKQYKLDTGAAPTP